VRRALPFLVLVLLLVLLLAGLASAGTLEIRLDRELQPALGKSGALVLRGPNAVQWLSFTLPHDALVKSARLSLRLRPASGLLAGSNFAVAVNGTPVHAVRLDGARGSEVLVEGAIPIDALDDYNRLELRAEMHDTPGYGQGHCESPTDPALWVAVDGASRLTFELGGYKHEPRPEDFPLPLADPLDYRVAHVRFVLPPHATSADYALAAHLAGALGERMQGRAVDLRAVDVFDPAADASQVLIGAAAASVSAPLDGEGRLRLVARENRPYLLLIEGSDAAARQKAVNVAIPSGPQNGRLRGLLPENESFTLADLAPMLVQDASGPGITVRGAEPEAIVIPLRPGAGEHFVRGEQNVHFEYAYGPQVDVASSALEVRLNGKTLAGRPLERAAGSPAESIDVLLPAEAMGAENFLEMRFHLYPKNAGACSASGGTGGGPDGGAALWATLLDSSSFHLPRDLYADLPDLSLLRGGGVPFTYGRTIWVAPSSNMARTATLFLNAAFLLGRLSGAAPEEVRFESELDAAMRHQSHLIVLNEAPELKLAEAISPWNAQRVVLSVSGSPDSAARLLDPTLIARLSGAATQIDSSLRVRVTPAGATTRFGEIRLNRRVKYWVMDNVAWVMLDSIVLLIVAMQTLRYIRRHYFPPLPDTGGDPPTEG